MVVVTVLTLATVVLGLGEYVYRYTLASIARRDIMNYSDWSFITPDSSSVRWYEPLRNMALSAYFSMPRPVRNRALLSSGLPVYDLRIAPRHLGLLRSTSEVVTARSFSVGVPLDYVPGKFLMNGDWVPVKVKLRGLTSLHFIPARPSLRIKFPPTRALNGKRSINLTDPYDKGLTADATTNWELQRCGVLTWESQFVVLRMNGEVTGLFQEIEHFGRSMTDRTDRPEGHIFSGTGQYFGNGGFAYDKALAAFGRLHGCVYEAAPPTDGACDWSFVEDYFDAERMACAASMAALLGSSHAWDPDNLRLYYDPARGTFEPIPWDYSFYLIDPSQHPEGEVTSQRYGLYLTSVPQFRRLRDRHLWSLLTDRLGPMLDHANQMFRNLTGPLKNDSRHPDFGRDQRYHASYTDILQSNAGFLHDLFSKHDLRVAHSTSSDGSTILNIRNHGKSYLSIDSLMLSTDGVATTYKLPTPILVDGHWRGRAGQNQYLLRLPVGARVVSVNARDRVSDTPLAPEDIHVVNDPDGVMPKPQQLNPPSLRLPANVGIQGTTVTFNSGTTRLEENLHIPRSHRVVFAPGLTLELADNVSLIIYGDLEAIGTHEKPISIVGINGTDDWGTLAVHGTRARPSVVHLAHVTMKGGRGGESQRVHFTGSLSVHDGIVSISNSTFLNGGAEDGINLKNAEIDLVGNGFFDAASDAIDLDFCRGQFTHNQVLRSANDCLDFSGSRVMVSGNHISNCGDKGISIGERSEIALLDNVVARSRTGVAVKDGSTVSASQLVLAYLDAGIALYVKKPTYGAGQASLERTVLYEVETPLLLDSRFALDISASVRYFTPGTGAPPAPSPFLTLPHASIRADRELKTLLTELGPPP